MMSSSANSRNAVQMWTSHVGSASKGLRNQTCTMTVVHLYGNDTSIIIGEDVRKEDRGAILLIIVRPKETPADLLFDQPRTLLNTYIADTISALDISEVKFLNCLLPCLLKRQMVRQIS